MSRATPLMRNFAERLVACESQPTKSSGSPAPVVFHVCEKLRPHLTTLIGKGGFGALVSRALALSSAEAPGLRAVQVQADGTLALGGEVGEPGNGEKLAEGGVVLLAQMLGLLEAFIGQNLTVRMLCEVWPTLSLNDLYFDQEDQK